LTCTNDGLEISIQEPYSQSKRIVGVWLNIFVLNWFY